MPSELPKFGTPRRGTPVFVPRQSIFSSSVMSERRLSILFSIGRAGFLKGGGDCCAVAETRVSARRLNMLESRFIIRDSYCLKFSVIVTRIGRNFLHRVPSANEPRLPRSSVRTPKHDLLKRSSCGICKHCGSPVKSISCRFRKQLGGAHSSPLRLHGPPPHRSGSYKGDSWH